jgi:hypothetical protein
MRPLVLPRIAQPSALLDAEDTLPPDFMFLVMSRFDLGIAPPPPPPLFDF